MSETQVRWSEDNQVYFLDGEAYSVNRFGRTAHVGTEEEVLKEHPVVKTGTGTRRHQTAK